MVVTIAADLMGTEDMVVAAVDMVDLNTVEGMVVTIAADLMGTEDMVVAAVGMVDLNTGEPIIPVKILSRKYGFHLKLHFH
jgi:hypothetical protein